MAIHFHIPLSFSRFIVIALMAAVACPSAFAQRDELADSARHLLAGKEYANAARLLARADSVTKHDPELLRLLGQAYHCEGGREKAQECFAKACDLETCDTCHDDLDSLCVILFEEGKCDELSGATEKAVLHKSPDAGRFMGMVHIARGNELLKAAKPEDALREYDSALTTGVDTLMCGQMLVCYSVLGRDEEEKALAERIKKEYPQSEEVRTMVCEEVFDRARASARKREYKSALSLYDSCMVLDPSKTAELALYSAYCYLALEDTPSAISYFGNAMFDRLTAPTASVAMANIYIARRQAGVAFQMLMNSLNSFPANPAGWTKIGELYAASGYPAEARECEKMSALLGDSIVGRRLAAQHISYDTVRAGLFPWFKRNPYTKPNVSEEEYSNRLEPPDFVPIESRPVPVKQVQPQYPELARLAGIEGTVWVKMLISRLGIVKRVLPLYVDAEVLMQPALTAAMQWKFIPILMAGGRPASFWAVMPFRFKLNR